MLFTRAGRNLQLLDGKGEVLAGFGILAQRKSSVPLAQQLIDALLVLARFVDLGFAFRFFHVDFCDDFGGLREFATCSTSARTCYEDLETAHSAMSEFQLLGLERTYNERVCKQRRGKTQVSMSLHIASPYPLATVFNLVLSHTGRSSADLCLPLKRSLARVTQLWIDRLLSVQLNQLSKSLSSGSIVHVDSHLFTRPRSHLRTHHARSRDDATQADRHTRRATQLVARR